MHDYAFITWRSVVMILQCAVLIYSLGMFYSVLFTACVVLLCVVFSRLQSENMIYRQTPT